ncbi:hypothetical protein LENED_009229 [Lentinula edodes]|uniref:Zn(2)-C6 fungal-type domain-containing protein n=1 Tax=Lentinula edodes TaxID=5353 RepID=A0A1Q3EJ80_LENED|nr:hypothetical protein LENED_009229 [Lentinula edodes]
MISLLKQLTLLVSLQAQRLGIHKNVDKLHYHHYPTNSQEEAAARKVVEEAEKKKKAVARRQAAQDARNWATQAQEQEDGVIERRRKLAAAATARSQEGTSTGEVSVSLRRLVVEIPRVKGKGKARAQPVGEDPDNGDDDEEDQEPCERCKVKKIPCLKQAGKRSSVICKPCHNSKVQCLYSGRPYTVKREGGASPSSEQLAVLDNQMAQVLADNRALREANSKSHQYLRQLLRRQEDDHAQLISMDTRMALMDMREGPVTAGPLRRTAEWRRIVEESEEEEEEEKEVEEKEREVEKNGEGKEEEMEEEETAPTEAQLEKGREEQRSNGVE